MEVTYVDHLTKTQKRIVEAKEKGYHISDDGILYGIKGKLSVKKSGNQRYPTFSSNWGGYVYGIPVHQFAAYIFYGEEAFTKGIVVRHLDGNTENVRKENIVLGSHSENNMDKSPEIRSNSARKARQSQGVTPKNAKLSEKDILEIRRIYAERCGKKMPNGSTSTLAKKFGVSRATIGNVASGVYYAG